MARTRSENYDGIHLGILTNAARLFSAQGYMRASIADLADACKLSRGALYHYFDSKEAILFAILDAHIREMIEHVETAVAAGGPTLTQFQNVIRAIVEVNAKSPHEQRVLIHDLSFLNEDEQQALKGSRPAGPRSLSRRTGARRSSAVELLKGCDRHRSPVRQSFFGSIITLPVGLILEP